MIIQCQSCAAKYFLPEEKVPVNPLKVRCPKCQAVFMLAPQRERVAAAAQPASAPKRKPAPATEPPVMKAAPPEIEPVDVESPMAQAMPAPAAEEKPAAKETPAASGPQAAPAAAPSRSSRGGKSAEDRAKRLARVLVSDILWYNRDRRDAALRDGTLVTSLGEEIKKSWELYKEKVGPEAAHSTNYFKEALNEILADGQQVF